MVGGPSLFGPPTELVPWRQCGQLSHDVTAYVKLEQGRILPVLALR